jgi:hypothetical protein
MRILVLILASDGNPEYVQFQELWRMYTKSHPNIDCLFYKGNPSMEKAAELIGDTVYVKIEDTLDTVYDKLMMTLRFLEPSLHKYDFMYRTNLSSFVDFEKYYHFSLLLPTTNVCAAVIGHHEGIVFPSGAGFTLSIDLVRRLIQENHPNFYLDDVTIGKAMSTWGIQYIRTNRIDYKGNGIWTFEHQPSPNELIFHYRVKTENRDEDCNILNRLVIQSFRPYTNI